MKEKIVIIGGGGHSKVIISILKKINKYKIYGYTDIKNKGEILGIAYLGNDDKLSSILKQGVKNAVIGVGQIKSSTNRRKLFDKIKNIGFIFPPIISPNAVINENVLIGDGTVIMDGVVINSCTRIGEFCIVNTKSSIDHDCNIGNFTHIAPGVTISGGVNIGNDCLIGAGSTIIQGVTIGENSLIAAGAVVVNNIEKNSFVFGIPAKNENNVI